MKNTQTALSELREFRDQKKGRKGRLRTDAAKRQLAYVVGHKTT